MENYKQIMKEHDNEMRNLRSEIREKTRVLILERDELKKELKKCNKEMSKLTSTNNSTREYNELNIKYMNCQEELRLLKALGKSMQSDTSIVPFQEKMVFTPRTGNSLKNEMISPRERPSFLKDISEFNKNKLKTSLISKNETKRRLDLKDIEKFNKNKLKSRERDRQPSKMQNNPSQTEIFNKMLLEKFKNVIPPSESDSEEEWFSTKKKSRKSSKRKSKTVKRKSKTVKRKSKTVKRKSKTVKRKSKTVKRK
jgi:hypothetical protein